MRRLLLFTTAVAIVAAVAWWTSSQQSSPVRGEGEPPKGAAAEKARAPGSTARADDRVPPAHPAPEAQPAAPSPAPAGRPVAAGLARFSGRVVARTGEHVPGAELTVTGGADEAKASTDAAGRFTFDLAPGAYRLVSVSAAGFDPFHGPVIFDAVAGQAVDDVVIMLDPHASSLADQPEDSGALPFGGTVVDADGRPVPGAEVRARGAYGTIVTTSGDGGRFRFDTTLGGTFMYAVRGRQVSPPAAVVEGAFDAVLRLSAEGGFITGRVSDPTGGARTSFTVSLSRPMGRLEERSLDQRPFASPSGDYRIGPVTPGDYRLRADASGFAPSAPKTVSVVAGESAVADLQLRPAATLTGQVLNEASGEPVPGAVVSLETAYIRSRQAKAGGDGRFTLTGLPPGLFSVRAVAEGFHRRLLSGLRAVEGQPVGPVEIRLSPLKSPEEEPKNQLAGIGAGLRARGDALMVTQVLAGGGAAEVGIRSGDRILTIDGRAVGELDFNGVIQLIRGPEGSTVLLTIQRDGQTQTINVPRRAISS